MYYVYNKRFQPLNKQNEEEIKWLVQNTDDDDKIILGVINYNPQSSDKADRMEDDERFDLIYNPLSYWERYLQLSNFCEEQKSIDPKFNKIIAITPLPRPSVNINTAKNYLPDLDSCKICVSIVHNNEYEDRKLRGYKNQGISLTRVLQLPTYEFAANLRIITPELIFCLMALADNSWRTLVSENALRFIDSVRLSERLTTAGLSAAIAKEKIKKIYHRAPEDEKAVLDGFLNRYLNENETKKSTETVSLTALKDAVKKIFEERSAQDKYNLEHLSLIIKNLGEKSPAAVPLIIERTVHELRKSKLDNLSLMEQTAISTAILTDYESYLRGLRKRLDSYCVKTEDFIRQVLAKSNRYIDNAKLLAEEFNLIEW